MSQNLRTWLLIGAVAVLGLFALYSGGALDSFVAGGDVEVVDPLVVFEPLPNGNVQITEARVATVFSANSFSVVVLDVADDADGTTNSRLQQFVGRTIYVYATGHEASCGLYHFDVTNGVLTGATADGLIAGEIIALNGTFDNSSTGTYPTGHLVATCGEIFPISNN